MKRIIVAVLAATAISACILDFDSALERCEQNGTCSEPAVDGGVDAGGGGGGGGAGGGVGGGVGGGAGGGTADAGPCGNPGTWCVTRVQPYSFPGARRIAVVGPEDAWFAGGNKVRHYKNGAFPTPADPSDFNSEFKGLVAAPAPDGGATTVYIADWQWDTVKVLTSQGLWSTLGNTAPIGSPQNMVAVPNSNALLLSADGPKVFKYTPSGGGVVAWDGGSSTSANGQGLFAFSEDDFIVTGRDALAVRVTNGVPTPLNIGAGATETLYSVWASGPNDIWIGGEDKLYRYDGSSWSSASIAPYVVGIWGTGPNDVWLATGNGPSEPLFHFDGTSFETVPTGAVFLYDVRGDGIDTVYATGDVGDGGYANFILRR